MTKNDKFHVHIYTKNKRTGQEDSWTLLSKLVFTNLRHKVKLTKKKRKKEKKNKKGSNTRSK